MIVGMQAKANELINSYIFQTKEDNSVGFSISLREENVCGRNKCGIKEFEWYTKKIVNCGIKECEYQPFYNNWGRKECKSFEFISIKNTNYIKSFIVFNSFFIFL